MSAKNTAERFWSLVEKKGPTECWLWQGKSQASKGGHHTFKLGGYHTTVQRLAWWLSNGVYPEGWFVLHRCDNPICCNPAHLFLGTQKDNVHDMIAKGRKRQVNVYGEQHGGAKYTDLTVKEVRQMYATGRFSQDALAKYFGMGQSHISRIVRGESRAAGPTAETPQP